MGTKLHERDLARDREARGTVNPHFTVPSRGVHGPFSRGKTAGHTEEPRTAFTVPSRCPGDREGDLARGLFTVVLTCTYTSREVTPLRGVATHYVQLPPMGQARDRHHTDLTSPTMLDTTPPHALHCAVHTPSLASTPPRTTPTVGADPRHGEATMPTRAPTPCPTCSTLEHCAHRGQARRHRSSRTWTTTSADLIAAHVAQHGWTCPGWPDTNHAPHPSRDLTVHHVDQLHTTGHDTGEYAVLCRSENSALG